MGWDGLAGRNGDQRTKGHKQRCHSLQCWLSWINMKLDLKCFNEHKPGYVHHKWNAECKRRLRFSLTRLSHYQLVTPPVATSIVVAYEMLEPECGQCLEIFRCVSCKRNAQRMYCMLSNFAYNWPGVLSLCWKFCLVCESHSMHVWAQHSALRSMNAGILLVACQCR